MSTRPKPRLTPDEYLEIERNAPFRSEYIAGEMFAMAGGTSDHNTITGNFVSAVRPQLRGTGYFVYSSDMKVWIPRFEEYVYPDGILVCAEREFQSATRDVLLNPKIIVEVLSPGTANYDRGDQFEKYQMISSFTEYLLIAQERMHLDYYQRVGPQRWDLTIHTGQEDHFALVSVPVRIILRDLYEDVNLPEASDMA